MLFRSDGPVSFLQMLKKSISTKGSEDKFADVRPLLVVAGDGSFSGSGNNLDGFGSSLNGSPGGCQELGNEYPLPTFVHFYSLRTHDYVHVLKFRTAVYSVRCSPRVVAVLQASQVCMTLYMNFLFLHSYVCKNCIKKRNCVTDTLF